MVEDILEKLSISRTEEVKNEHVKFVTVQDRNNPVLKLDLQYVNNELYAIYFLNNQFYELAEQELVTCLKDIVDGNYKVKRRLLIKRRPWIVTGSLNTSPERLTSAMGFLDIYSKLPKPWSLKETT